MCSNSQQKKHDQLGMPFGTASGRLRKKIMLALLRRLDADICYRCKTTIETPEELSIDHKEDWLDNDPALFWDLRNVAFSHFTCNRPHRQSGGRTRRQNKRSKYRGVSWAEKASNGSVIRKWGAYTSHKNKNVFLGFFESETEAAQAYDKAAKRLRGSKARLNFPDDGQ